MLLSYRLPREPSTPRITLWRQLKRLGAAVLVDSVAALPADARTQEQLEWLAQDVIAAGGVAGVWVATATAGTQLAALVDQLRAARAAEYAALTAAAAAAAGVGDPAVRAQAVTRLRSRWRQIIRRDYFPPVERDAAQAALQSLAQTITAVAVAGGGVVGRSGVPR